MRKVGILLATMAMVGSIFTGSAAQASEPIRSTVLESTVGDVAAGDASKASARGTADYLYKCKSLTGDWNLQSGQAYSDCQGSYAIWIYLNGAHVDTIPLDFNGNVQNPSSMTGACLVNTAVTAAGVVALIVSPPTGVYMWATQAALQGYGMWSNLQVCRV